MPRLARTIARDWFTGRINDKDLQQEALNHTTSAYAMRERLDHELRLLGATDAVIHRMRRITGDPKIR